MTITRLCEWGSAQVSPVEWPREKRHALLEAANAWRQAHRLNALPLEWSGADGRILKARQWVGVVEIEGSRVEIYPKTDAAFINRNELNEGEAQSTLHTLLHLLEAADYSDWIEADRAALQTAPLTFIDVWAYLWARNLWPHLRRGLPRTYLAHEDDLPAVRGRILLSRQLVRYGERLDHLLCAWDEFSPDMPLLRLIKCACHFLRGRVTHPVTTGLLGDCLFMLDDVQDISPLDALRSTANITWTRALEYLRPSFDLARNILQGLGPQLGAGSETTWVFLVDMNRVFERFCRVALEARFPVVIEEQKSVGWIFSQPYRLRQLPDYTWQYKGAPWIGDAKWKLLAGEITEDENNKTRLSPDDVRQLVTYAELQYFNAHKAKDNAKRPQLAIFYPDLNKSAAVKVLQTWNETQLHLVPLRVAGWNTIEETLPPDFAL